MLISENGESPDPGPKDPARVKSQLGGGPKMQHARVMQENYLEIWRCP
jgi:hypothetical protein